MSDDQRIIDKLADSITLLMFNCPRENKSDVIPNGYVPIDQLKFVLLELGFNYLALNKRDKIIKKIGVLPKRDLAKGDQFISVLDLVAILGKYIKKYTDRQKLIDVIKFFDPAGTGEISPVELEGMLESFGKTEGSYIDEDQLKLITKCGRVSRTG
jgi:Ca2+-binding EF-hand superfamily protein